MTKGVLICHRKFAATINALIIAGLAIERVDEYSPSAEEIAECRAVNPNLTRQLERPNS